MPNEWSEGRTMRLINKKNQANHPFRSVPAEKSDAAYTNNNAGRQAEMRSAGLYFLFISCFGVWCVQGQGVATFFLFNTTPYTYSYFNRDFAAEKLTR